MTTNHMRNAIDIVNKAHYVKTSLNEGNVVTGPWQSNDKSSEVNSGSKTNNVVQFQTLSTNVTKTVREIVEKYGLWHEFTQIHRDQSPVKSNKNRIRLKFGPIDFGDDQHTVPSNQTWPDNTSKQDQYILDQIKLKISQALIRIGVKVDEIKWTTSMKNYYGQYKSLIVIFTPPGQDKESTPPETTENLIIKRITKIHQDIKTSELIEQAECFQTVNSGNIELMSRTLPKSELLRVCIVMLDLLRKTPASDKADAAYQEHYVSSNLYSTIKLFETYTTLCKEYNLKWATEVLKTYHVMIRKKMDPSNIGAKTYKIVTNPKANSDFKEAVKNDSLIQKFISVYDQFIMQKA